MWRFKRKGINLKGSIIKMMEEEVFDDAQVNTVKLNFFDGENWVEDEERSKTVVKLIESGACK